MRIDPTGMLDGDYYGSDGNWLASDGIDDGKVYHANENGDKTFGVGILKETSFSEWTYEAKDSKFAEYMPTLLSHEGGFVDHPDDPGGATNKGVTLNTFKKYSEDLLGVKPTLQNLKKLSDSQAMAIYETGYWEPSGAGNISDKQLGWLHFDTYLHGGASSVLRQTTGSMGMQNSTNGLNKAINTYGAENAFYIYKSERLCRFDRLIEASPSFGGFKKGWYNRVNKFQYQE